MRIFLIGLPGSGKTTLGRALALRLQRPFIDLDESIEQTTGRKIATLLEEAGEPQFREIESRELRRCIAAFPSFVMATGGGTPCFHENMTRMNEAGKSVFLDVTPAALAARISEAQADMRPLFKHETAGTILPRIERLHAERLPFYKNATLTLKGDHLSVDDLEKMLRRD